MVIFVTRSVSRIKTLSMRKWIPTLGLLLVANFSHAQLVDLFIEDFDSTVVQTTTTTEDNINGNVISGGWNLASNLSVSSPNSMRGVRTINKTKYLYTDFFSTVNLTNVRLEFDHICKLNLVQQGRVEYSIDSGATWTSIPGSAYLGASPGYNSTVYFNGGSYPNPSATPYWDPFNNTSPTSNWWAHETFDLSSLLVNATTPYTHCQIRFAVVDVNPNIAASFAGWYVDNIDIIGSTCELQPPQIRWNFSTARQPIGPRYQSNQEIRLEASDAGAGVDSVLLTYSLNGAPDTTILMTAAVSASCPAVSQYFYTIPGLVVGDTVEWQVYVEDCACPNIALFPDQAAADPFAKFWIDPSPPAKCGPTSTNSFPYIVANYPFTESFENPGLWTAGTGNGNSGSAHRGDFPLGNPPSGRNWQVNPLPTASGYGWSVRNGPTGTANTGPNGDATTGSGNYLYTEASQGGGGVNTSPLFTPCFDLPANTCAVLEFKYHMYGSSLDNTPRGVLRVDIDTSTGTNTGQFVTGVSVFVGSQHTSSNDMWSTAIIPLEDYAGQTINFRFLGVKRTAGDMQDIAIDDISIYEPSAIDFELVNFENPVNGLCSYSNAEDIEFVIRSKGCSTQDSIPVGFSVSLNGGTPVIQTDVITDTMELGDVINFIPTPKADLSQYGVFEIYAWVDMPGDGDNDNDTIGPLFIEHIQPVNQFPYTEDFDGAGWAYSGGNINNPGTYGNTDWLVLPPVNQADLAFVVGREVTEDFNTGPRRDFSGDGNYLYTDSRTSGTNFARYELDRCVDLTNMTNPSISFWYHMYGSNINFIKIQYQLDGTTAWLDVPGGAVTSPQQSSTPDDWRWKRADLSAYTGGLVRLRFLAQSGGTGDANDVAIDNIMIWDEDNQTDVGAAIITSPNVANLSAPTQPATKVLVQNYGESAVSNVPLTVIVTDACDPSKTNTINYTVAGPIAAHTSSEITLPNNPAYYQGVMHIQAYTRMANDANSWNDTTNHYPTGIKDVAIPYLNEDFDSCSYDTKGWFNQGGLRAWEHGTPSKGNWNSSYSSPNSWNTGNNFEYQNKNETLRVPALVGFDTVVGAILRFRHRFDFSGGDGGRIEYFDNGSWNQFGFNSTQVGVNWYDVSGVAAFNGGEGWTGSSAGWVLSEFPLLIWNFNPNPLRLRYQMQTTGTTTGGRGWSIDDFNVIVPPQNSVSPIFGETEEYLVIPNGPATIKARVQNTGEKVLDGYSIRFSVDGTWFPWEQVTSRNMFKGKVVGYTFNQKTNNLTPGLHTIEIQTSRPVSAFDSIPKADNRPADDLYTFTISVLPEVTPTRDSSNYCNDFEDPNAIPLVALHSYDKQLPQEWEFGNPTQPTLPGTHSGVNAWSVDLDSNYENLNESSLHTPFFNLVPDSVYEFSFWHQMNGEQYHDGGAIEFSFNGGINWYTLGSVNPNGTWYNTTHVTSLNRLSGGWSGQFPWTKSVATFSVDTIGTVVFRWRFASDYTVESAGWTIDDFCFNLTGKAPSTGPISIEELEPSAIGDLSIFPNPADQYTDINILSSVSGEAEIAITNLLGQTIFTTNENLVIGKNSVTVNTESFTNGMYIANVTINGEQRTMKFIVTHE